MTRWYFMEAEFKHHFMIKAESAEQAENILYKEFIDPKDSVDCSVTNSFELKDPSIDVYLDSADGVAQDDITN